jgi:hypothetical protein
MAKDEVNAGNPQWKKLQEMRAARGEKVAPVEAAPPVPDVAAVPPPVEQPRGEDGKFVAKEPDAPPPPAAVAAPKEPEAPAPTPPAAPQVPAAVEIEIDGQKMSVAPEIADAFKKAEAIKKDSAVAEARAALKAEVLAEVRAELPPPKTEAEKAADAAIAAAEAAAKLPKKPDAKLLISDPEEWQKQQDVYEESRINAATAKVKAEIADKQQTDAKTAFAQREEAARRDLRDRFYVAYPSLKDSADIVDTVLNDKFNEVLASGKVNKPLTVAEGEELMRVSFADAATRATKKIVKVMNAGKSVVPPVAPPPALASSAPVHKAPPKVEEDATPRERYPKGSVSASLAAVRARKLEANA